MDPITVILSILGIALGVAVIIFVLFHGPKQAVSVGEEATATLDLPEPEEESIPEGEEIPASEDAPEETAEE